MRRQPRRGSLGTAGGAVGGVLALTTLPRLLPPRVVALRSRVFARINGPEGIPIPGPMVDASRFLQVYGDPAANGRSRGAALSDLFWYWLSPGAEVHQEHIEAGDRYDEVARATRRILAVPPARVTEMATRHTAAACSVVGGGGTVRLRDLMMPVWAGFFYEVVFGRPCPPEARDLVVANADDVVTALKCCGVRHMGRRDRLTRYLVAHLDEVPHPLPACLSPREQALYLQGTYFNTAVVQMSEAMAHLLLALSHNAEVQADVAARPDDGALLGRVMDETWRMYPLFGIAHRVATDDIEVDDRTTLPAGSVLCFSYPDYHRSGVDDPERFDPSRWEQSSPEHAIPFGVVANRPCPARHLAPTAMRAATREVLRHFALRSSAGHSRSLPNRGPCLLVPRASSGRRVGPTLAAMRLRDQWEDLGRSVVQLALGTYMVWDARRLRLCQRHFERAEP